MLVWVLFVPCPCWRAGTALRQVSGVATRSHRTLAANTFVKPSSNAATEPAAHLPLAPLVSESTLSGKYSQTPEFSDQLHFFPFQFKLWEGYPLSVPARVCRPWAFPLSYMVIHAAVSQGTAS